MSPKEPAERQFERALYLLARIQRDGGATIAELAGELKVSRERVLRDLIEISDRDDSDDFQIILEGDRVQVFAPNFPRPPKLWPREVLALALGLRVVAEGASEEEAARIRGLMERVDGALAALPAGALSGGFEVESGDPKGEALLDLLEDACRDRQAVRLRYLKEGAAATEDRVLRPYRVVYARGNWYAIGYCEKAEAVREFRLDRILAVDPVGEDFEVPPDFDPAEYQRDGALYRAGEEFEATVRFSPRVARWILERGDGEPQPDGSVIQRFGVADPRWIVRLVLYYGRDAELLGPAELRDQLRDVLDGMAVC